MPCLDIFANLSYDRDCQKKNWKSHKEDCKLWTELAKEEMDLQDQEYRMKVHSREFRRIVAQYGLSKGEKADQLANLLTNTSENEHISPEAVAAQFDMPRHDASTLLSWVDVGLRFKEEALDANRNLMGQS